MGSWHWRPPSSFLPNTVYESGSTPATGGLETPVASALAAAGIAVAIVNPRQVRDFARATGRLAKTDRLDAEVLARFGEAVRPEARPLANEQAKRSKHWLLGGASWSRC